MDIINLFESQIDNAKSGWEIKIIDEKSDKKDQNNKENTNKDIAKELNND